jgi:hypothetical protein
MTVLEFLATHSTCNDGARRFKVPVMGPVDLSVCAFLRVLLGARGPLILDIRNLAYMCVGPFGASRDRWVAACGDSSMPQAGARVRIDNYMFDAAECVVQAALEASPTAVQKQIVDDGSHVRPVVCLAKETLDSITWASFTETTA